MKNINVRKLAEFMWEIDRLYHTMLDDYNDPNNINEAWEDAGFDEQNNFVDQITQFVYGGDFDLDQRLGDLEKQREVIGSQEETKRPLLLKSYTINEIYLRTIKALLRTYSFVDKDNKDIQTNWKH